MLEYTFRDWAPSGVTAQAVGEELERIRQANGGQLNPKRVVAEAYPSDAPLHEAFNWDDAEAADQWRLREARQLIRSVRVVIVGAKTEPAFIHVKMGDVQFYQATRIAVRRKHEWAAAVNGLLATLNSAQRAVDELMSVAPDRTKKPVRAARRAIHGAVKAARQVAV